MFIYYLIHYAFPINCFILFFIDFGIASLMITFILNNIGIEKSFLLLKISYVASFIASFL